MVQILSPETISRRFFEGMYKVLLEITTSWFFCKRPHFRVEEKWVGPSRSRNPHQHAPSVKKHTPMWSFIFVSIHSVLHAVCILLFCACSFHSSCFVFGKCWCLCMAIWTNESQIFQVVIFVTIVLSVNVIHL